MSDSHSLLRIEHRARKKGAPPTVGRPGQSQALFRVALYFIVGVFISPYFMLK
jgi:hypothetical protein